jgi:hypothetical protein
MIYISSIQASIQIAILNVDRNAKATKKNYKR